jgi:hypothetical protein
VAVTLAQDQAQDLLDVIIEDDGPGLSVSFEEALDPFYTTKSGKKIGMGLSLFKFRAEQAGGSLTLGTSELGGLKVTVRMQLSHIDRSPLGDFATTLSTLVCTTPEVDLQCCLRSDSEERYISVAQVTEALPAEKRQEFAIASIVYHQIREALAELSFDE